MNAPDQRRYDADVVIVGGGFMGAATAFFLRQRGRSVILLERGLVGQQASGVNFGNVRRQGRFLPQLPLANRSRAIWGRLPELLGEDVEFLPSGHVRLCYDPVHLDALEEYAKAARQLGLDLELLSQQTVRKRFPYLTHEVAGASYAPVDGHANPRLAAPAFARAAVRAGAKVIENTEIAAVEKDGEDFRATATDGRIFRAPAMLITAGAWGSLLSEQFGEAVPIVARGPQMSVTEPIPYKMREVFGVMTKIEREVVYCRQIPRGNIIIGGSTRGPAFPDIRRAYALPTSTMTQMAEIRRLIPAFGRLNIIRTWSGIEGYMPDDRPIMGPSGKVSGLFYAFGFCGHGFQLGPGVGDVMAELIDTGSTTTPIEPFQMARFAVPVAVAGGVDE
ncbi:FAD-binding oxidoreductase [Pigmentiphaga aceris]|uniref:FAD-binding oxidoreductase n=2 Tax=Pigmentiphaga aceris TaxID=1940612 RepID=A0A5C0B5W1_9BURK|nr:FAD-binding oxidoreductase [Pigmentiphaga aceris]